VAFGSRKGVDNGNGMEASLNRRGFLSSVRQGVLTAEHGPVYSKISVPMRHTLTAILHICEPLG